LPYRSLPLFAQDDSFRLDTTSLLARVITSTVKIITPNHTDPAVVTAPFVLRLLDNSKKTTEILCLEQPTPSDIGRCGHELQYVYMYQIIPCRSRRIRQIFSLNTGNRVVRIQRSRPLILSWGIDFRYRESDNPGCTLGILRRLAGESPGNSCRILPFSGRYGTIKDMAGRDGR